MFTRPCAQLLAVAIPLASLPGVLGTVADSQIPLIGLAEDQEYGIGFDLTPSYGTAAISYANGTLTGIARVEGSEEYKELMLHLSTTPEHRPWNPQYRPRDVRILSEMVKAIRKAAEQRLGHAVPAAAATFPHLSGLSFNRGDPTMKAVFETVGLDYIQIVRFQYSGDPLTYPEHSLLAAHSLGLCQPYTIRDHYCYSQQNLTETSYIFIGYYSDGIEVTTTTNNTVSAYSVMPYHYDDFRLGSKKMHDNPDEEYYWEEVRELISTPLYAFSWHKPRNVVLYGDSCGSEKFQSVVDEVLRRFLGPDELPDWVTDDVDPVFAGAMGAAEFAKRKPYWGWP